MKNTKTLAATLFAVAGIQIASAQITTWNAGDLIVGFRSTDGAETNSLLVNVGSVFAIRDGGDFSVNVNSQLTSLYGADWFTAGNIFFGAVTSAYATNSTDTSAPNGDPGRTTYFTQATTTIGFSGTDAADTMSTSQRSTFNTNILSLINGTSGFVGQVDNGNNSASMLNTNSNSWAGKTSGPSDFGILGNPNEVDTRINGVTTYADLYRMIAYTTNAVKPVNAQIDNTVGNSQFVATLQITSDGTISTVGQTAPIPEPSSFAAIAGVAALGLVASRRRRA